MEKWNLDYFMQSKNAMKFPPAPEPLITLPAHAAATEPWLPVVKLVNLAEPDNWKRSPVAGVHPDTAGRFFANPQTSAETGLPVLADSIDNPAHESEPDAIAVGVYTCDVPPASKANPRPAVILPLALKVAIKAGCAAR